MRFGYFLTAWKFQPNTPLPLGTAHKRKPTLVISRLLATVGPEEEDSCMTSLTKNILLQLIHLVLSKVHGGLHPHKLITLGLQIIMFVLGLENMRNRYQKHFFGWLDSTFLQRLLFAWHQHHSLQNLPARTNAMSIPNIRLCYSLFFTGLSKVQSICKPKQQLLSELQHVTDIKHINGSLNGVRLHSRCCSAPPGFHRICFSKTAGSWICPFKSILLRAATTWGGTNQCTAPRMPA